METRLYGRDAIAMIEISTYAEQCFQKFWEKYGYGPAQDAPRLTRFAFLVGFSEGGQFGAKHQYEAALSILKGFDDEQSG